MKIVASAISLTPPPSASSRYISSAQADAPQSQFFQAWLKRRNFHAFTQKFANFSGSDLLSLSREDMLQIGVAPPQIHVAEVIRLHNAIMK